MDSIIEASCEDFSSAESSTAKLSDGKTREKARERIKNFFMLINKPLINNFLNMTHLIYLDLQLLLHANTRSGVREVFLKFP